MYMNWFSYFKNTTPHDDDDDYDYCAGKQRQVNHPPVKQSIMNKHYYTYTTISGKFNKSFLQEQIQDTNMKLNIMYVTMKYYSMTYINALMRIEIMSMTNF